MCNFTDMDGTEQFTGILKMPSTGLVAADRAGRSAGRAGLPAGRAGLPAGRAGHTAGRAGHTAGNFGCAGRTVDHTARRAGHTAHGRVGITGGLTGHTAVRASHSEAEVQHSRTPKNILFQNRQKIRTDPNVEIKTSSSGSISATSGTNPADILSTNLPATGYEWYFEDECNNWIKFGQLNTANNSRCTANVTSKEIEEAYSKKKIELFEFRSASHRYVIDFKNMIQTNKKSNVSRKIERRPVRRPDCESNIAQTENNTFPPLWTSMDPVSISEQFILNSKDSEYVRNASLVRKTLPNCNIIEIKRIQTPHLWKAYQNQKEYHKKKSKEPDIKEDFLFHGTNSTNINAICEQNLDWRLHGSNVGQAYGAGTYFSNRLE